MFHHLKFESSQRELALCKEEACNCGDIFSEFGILKVKCLTRLVKTEGQKNGDGETRAYSFF